MGYGLPATVAVAGVPGLTTVTLSTRSLFSRPMATNSVPSRTAVVP